MKKLIIMLLAVMLAVPATVMADSSKTLRKQLEKEYKTKKKALEKEKWSNMGSRSMDVALLKHYDRLNEENTKEITGTGLAKSKNNAYQMARNNATINYAGDASSALKGRIMTDAFANGIETSEEFDHFYAAYERLVEQEIKGEMEESLSIFRTTPDGRYEVNVYYVVNEDKASKARLRALENAMKESQAAQKYAEKLSEFVNAGFE